MNTNAYHNAPPDRLLELKRQESDSLIQILNSINSDNAPETIASIAGFTLKGQLGIGKICLLIVKDQGLKVTMCSGVSSGVDFSAELSLFNSPLPSPVFKESQPLLYQQGIEYVMQLSGKTRAEGYLLVGDFAQSEKELQNDLIFMQTVSGILAIALENRRLFEEKVSQESFRRELALAESIQQKLLPSDIRDTPGIRVVTKNIPHQQIGGDFYELIPAGDKVYYFCMADVAGKSISAALVMAVVQASLRVLARYAKRLDEMIIELHNELFALNQGEKFVTLFLGKIDLNTYTLSYINAGHNPPVLKSRGNIRELTEGCIPLGIMSIEKPEFGNLRILPGDVLFLYTDGLTEQENPAGKMFGSESLHAWIKAYQGQNWVPDMLSELQKFSQGVNPSDDISLMSVVVE